MQFALDDGFRDVILEGDKLAVMNAIRSNEDGLVSSGAIVANIVRMSLSCNKVRFSFVKRVDNCVAHSFAKFASYVMIL